jgi:UDP-glucose 4-epimerase
MNILVTGGAGFIGSNVVDGLIEAGHSVIIVDNLSTGRRENLNKSAVFVELDIRSGELGDVFDKYPIEIIVHLAAQIDVRKSVDNPRYDAEINVMGGLNLLNCAHRNGVRKIIYSSTGGAIYGEPKYLPSDENHPIRPLCAYGVSKHVLEHYIEYYSDLYGMDYTILRYANVYGPRQDPLGEAGVVAIFTGKMLAGERPIIFGDGGQTRDFVYVGDVVKANLTALQQGSREIFNIGTGEETSVTSLYKVMQEILGFRDEPIYGEKRAGEVYRIYLDIKKAKSGLGWEPSTSFQEGLRKTIEFTKAHEGKS